MAARTKAQQRDDAKEAYEAYLRDCPSRKLLDRISDKWVVLVIQALSDGSMRYSELRTLIAGVSEKMLTQTLRNLERDGLIDREVTPSVPVRTDYELTDLGRSLLPVIGALKAWAEQNMDQIEAARAQHDAPG